MDEFKKGDKVKMIGCAGAVLDPDRIWICSTDQFTSKKGVECVRLLGIKKYPRGGFPCEYLVKVF